MDELEMTRMHQLEMNHEVLKTDINGQLKAINSKLDSIISGRGGNCIEHKRIVEELEKKVENITSNISWLWKSILGAILSGLGLLIFKTLIDHGGQ